MYQKLSKKSKFIFWTISSLILAIFIYSITFISTANVFELIIAGLGWLYLLGNFISWFNLVPEIFILKKKWRINTFVIIATIGILTAITLNITLNITRIPEALPITVIPAALVILYFIFILIETNKRK